MSDGETVVIHPGRLFDSDDNPVPAAGSSFSIEGCVVEPMDGDESAEKGRSGSTILFRVFTPGRVGRDIRDTDEIEIRGSRYRIEGAPNDWFDADDCLSGPVIHASIGRG